MTGDVNMGRKLQPACHSSALQPVACGVTPSRNSSCDGGLTSGRSTQLVNLGSVARHCGVLQAATSSQTGDAVACRTANGVLWLRW